MTGNMTLAGNSEFKSWVSQLKKDIRSAQVKAAIKVNTELLRLYWRMGSGICEKQNVERAVFYLNKTVENGWSRAVLLNFLDTNLYERHGKAVNNR